jgi:transposase
MKKTLGPRSEHFAAWFGLTPEQNSTSGKARLSGISRDAETISSDLAPAYS